MGLVNAGLEGILFQRLQGYWHEKIGTYLAEEWPDQTKPKVPAEMLIDHMVGTLVSLAKGQMTRKAPYTPAQMERYYWALIWPSVVSMFDENAEPVSFPG